MAGFFFCLASTRCRAFILSLYNTSPYKHLQRVLCRQCKLYRPRRKTVHRALQALFLWLDRWSVSQRRSTSSVCQIPPSRRTLYRTAQPPYYNKVYKGARVRPCYGSMPNSAAYRRPCQPGGVSVSTCTGSARRLAIWHRSAVRAHPPPGGAVQQQVGAAGGAEPLTATAVSLFGLSPDSQ